MLREARIVMPYTTIMAAAKGDVWSTQSLGAHRLLKERLCAAFGGFTMTLGHGGWVNEKGEVEKDSVAIYDVAIDSDRDAPWELIHRFAVEAGTALDQKSVYVRYPNGEVDIIKIDKPVETRNDTADALALAFSFDRFVDVGDGRAALGTKHLPQPGESWQTRAGARVWVGRRATVIDGGWYVTVVDPGPTHEKMMFEYVVNHDGKLIPALPGHDSPRDLVKRIH